MGKILSATDIGSNTVHILVAEVEDGKIVRLNNESVWLGLGQVVGQLGHIPDVLVSELSITLTRFKGIALAAGAKSMGLFATEALRRAENARSVLLRLRRETGLTVQLISGAQESELGLAGARFDCDIPDEFGFIEIGGGSVQLVTHSYQSSLPIGTGSLLARLKDKPTRESIRELILPHLTEQFASLPVFASGGVARGLVRALHPDGDHVLRREELEYLGWATERLTLSQVQSRFRVKQRRAATLLIGSTILQEVLTLFDREQLQVSEFGVREAMLAEIFSGRGKACPI